MKNKLLLRGREWIDVHGCSSRVVVERVFPLGDRVSMFCTVRGEAWVAPPPPRPEKFRLRQVVRASLEVEDLLWGSSVRVATAGPSVACVKRIRAGPLVLHLAVAKARGAPAAATLTLPPTQALNVCGWPPRVHFHARPVVRPLTRGAGVEARGHLQLPTDFMACDVFLPPSADDGGENESGAGQTVAGGVRAVLRELNLRVMC